jgi:Tfp pilus assembly protein PilF
VNCSSTLRAVLLVACLAAAAGCDSNTPEKRVARAEKLMDGGAYAEAMVEIKNALGKAPDDARVQLALARVSLQLGDHDAATKALDRAVQLGADAPAAASLRSQLLLQSGQYDALLKLLDDAGFALAEPARSIARAKALAGVRRFDEAIELARKLRAADPANVAASLVLAQSLGALGNPEAALDVVDGVVRQNESAAEAWLARGRLQQLLGHPGEAEESWTKVPALAGGQLTILQQVNMYSALADLQLARGDTAGARATFQKAVEIAPQGALTGLMGARVSLAEGQKETATATLRDLVRNNPGLPAARLTLISALLSTDNLEQATQQLTELAGSNPNATGYQLAMQIARRLNKADAGKEEYQLSVAAAQTALLQPAMARISLQNARKLAPESVRAVAALAQLELKNGNPGEALRMLQAMEGKPADAAVVLALLAEAQRVEKQYAQADATLLKLWKETPSPAAAALLYRVRSEGKLANPTELLQQWLAKHPEDKGIRGMYADALRKDGANREAIREFEKLLVVAPNAAPVINNLAWLYYLEKDKRALEMARRAWQQSPRHPTVADTYGWILVESGSLQEGLGILEGAYHDGGIADPDMQFHYAAALARAGQRDKARHLLAAVLEESAEFASRNDATKLAAELAS